MGYVSRNFIFQNNPFKVMRQLSQLSLFILFHLQQLFAPVPRCSPLFIINKVLESMSLTSDMNPYFPVAECEYGGPMQAILAGDFNSVFILFFAEEKNPG